MAHATTPIELDATNSDARAIEITAMFGGSVVDVKHVSDPRGGRVTAATYGLFAAGGALLVMAAISFSVAVTNARFNKRAEHHWTEIEQKPLYEFRPRRISVGFDWMAFGGLLGGVLCVTSGLVRLRRERVSPLFRVGHGGTVDFATDEIKHESFAMVAPLGDDFVFNFPHGMDGELKVDGRSTPLSELQAQGLARPSSTEPGAIEMPIPRGGRIRATAGANTFLVSSVPRPRAHATPLFASFESRAIAYFAGSALVHLSFWALLRTIPPDPNSLALGLGSNEGRMTRSESASKEDPKQLDKETLQDTSSESGGTGTAMALAAGKMGKTDSNRAEGRYTMKKRANMDPTLAKKAAMDTARTRGVAGALRAMQGDVFASVTGAGDLSSGLDDANIEGGLLGDAPGEMHGGFGFGTAGVGPGAGGTGWGTIGAGRYGTIGHGIGTGRAYGAGPGRGGMHARTSKGPDVDFGRPTTPGGLDKSIIRRYVRRQRGRIKYCYERELTVSKDIRGTVIANFQISPTGTVIGSRASGVHPKVSGCVASVIKTITFPKPRLGGLVQVRYPFHFTRQ